MPQPRSPIASGKPPLAVSPRRLRPRRPSRSAISSSQTPPAAATKIPIPHRSPASVSQMISSELLAMVKGVETHLAGGEGGDDFARMSNPLFERGRFYEAYSARRNERLKRKKAEEMADEMVAQDPAVAVELGKKRTARNVESVRKSVPAEFSVRRASGGLRSSLRSSKEMKKSATTSGGRASVDGGLRIATRSASRI